MTFEPIRIGRYRCDPEPARVLARELHELSQAAADLEAAYTAGARLDRGELDGEAGVSLRLRCRLRLDTAGQLCTNLHSLGGAAEELARDTYGIGILLDEMVHIARDGGLALSDGSIHPPHATTRIEDTPALVQGWRAWDRLTARHADVAARYERTVDDWVRALGRHGFSDGRDVLPPSGPSTMLGEQHRLDAESRAQWVEGHRGRDGEWVHAHWQPIGPDGHGTFFAAGSPHAGEHPTGATRARWVDGRWEPVVPEPRPPAIA